MDTKNTTTAKRLNPLDNLLGIHRSMHNQYLDQEHEVQSRLFHNCSTKKSLKLFEYTTSF